MTETKELSLIDVLIRHWKLAVIVTCACVVLAALVTQILPHRYESEMKFLVNNERADLVINPGKDQSAAAPSEVTETQVNSEIELLRSHDILEGIVLEHKLYLPFQSDKSAPPSRRSIARATVKLEKSLSVAALRKTNIIDVTYKDADPDAAVAILQDIGDRYLASHLLAHSAPGTDKFFSDQVKHFGVALASVRAELALFHQQRHLFSMPQQQAALVERFENVSSQLNEVNAQVHVQEARLAESAQQLSGVPERVVTQVKETADQFALQQLEPILAQLENRRIELATKFSPTDRLVRELDLQIASTSKYIAHIRSQRIDEETTDLDTLHQSIKTDATKSRIDLRGLQTQRVELEHMRQDCLRQLGDLEESYAILQNLEQREKEAQDNYLLYTHRLDEARLSEALDLDKFSNVVVIEKPVASPIAVSPKLALNLAAGLLVGLFLSLGWAFQREVREVEPVPISVSTAKPVQHLPDPPFQVAPGN